VGLKGKEGFSLSSRQGGRGVIVRNFQREIIEGDSGGLGGTERGLKKRYLIQGFVKKTENPQAR